MTSIIFNDDIITHCDHVVDCRDRGFLLGDGLFETLRAHQGKIFNLEQHCQRLNNSAAILQIPFKINPAELQEKITIILQANNLQLTQASIRITVTRGVGPRGLLPPPKHGRPSLLIVAYPYEYKSLAKFTLAISDIRRNEFSPTSNLKTLNYLDNILAKMAAQQADFDDALLLNTQENVACTTSANIFFVADNQIITPRLQDGVLPGITREIIIKLAQQLGVPLAEKSVAKSSINTMEEIFVTNSMIGVQAVTRVGDYNVAHGFEGILTEKIFQAYKYYQMNNLR